MCVSFNCQTIRLCVTAYVTAPMMAAKLFVLCGGVVISFPPLFWFCWQCHRSCWRKLNIYKILNLLPVYFVASLAFVWPLFIIYAKPANNTIPFKYIFLIQSYIKVLLFCCLVTHTRCVGMLAIKKTTHHYLHEFIYSLRLVCSFFFFILLEFVFLDSFILDICYVHFSFFFFSKIYATKNSSQLSDFDFITNICKDFLLSLVFALPCYSVIIPLRIKLNASIIILSPH